MASKKMTKADLEKLKQSAISTEEIQINTVEVDDDIQTKVELKEANEEYLEKESAKKDTTKKEDSKLKDTKEKETVSTNKTTKPKRKASSQSAKALEIELEKQKQIATEYQDKYQRLLAEFENARARTEKESMRMFDVGAKDVLEKFLPVVDNFERALMAIPEEDVDRAFEQGVDKIYKQLMVTFNDVGVVPMDACGTEFNPDLHNAVLHVEDDEYGDNTVIEEMQKGYMYKDSVLRYSMVKVAN